MKKRYLDRFSIEGKVCIITGGGGLIGMKHAEAVLEGDGIPVLIDISEEAMERVKKGLTEAYGEEPVMECEKCDITDRAELEKVRDMLLEKYGHIDILINNAANNPKVEGGSKNLGAIRFHNSSGTDRCFSLRTGIRRSYGKAGQRHSA